VTQTTHFNPAFRRDLPVFQAPGNRPGAPIRPAGELRAEFTCSALTMEDLPVNEPGESVVQSGERFGGARQHRDRRFVAGLSANNYDQTCLTVLAAWTAGFILQWTWFSFGGIRRPAYRTSCNAELHV